MVKLFIGLGALIFFAGAVAVGLALPYVVLERGFTQVIVGTVGMNAGLVLIGIGVVLREIRKGRVAGSVTASPIAAAVDAPQVESGAASPIVVAAATGIAVAASTGVKGATDRPEQPEPGWPTLDMPTAGPDQKPGLPTDEQPPLDVPRMTMSDFDDTQLVDTTGAMPEMPGQDEFTRLRAALSDQLERPDSPRAGSPQADRSHADAARDMNDEDIDLSLPQGDVATERGTVMRVSEPDDIDSPEPETLEAQTEEAPVLDAPRPAHEVVSNEGVLRAYQVGDTAFTIYGDGTIRAETRDGRYLFQSMEEVRAFLAQEKLKVRL